tara:strand:- start:9077 stop:9550 length:474 start_codon:yes stop_codon:yes gene_type:complete
MKISKYQIEVFVGSFVLAGFAALLFLTFKVAHVSFDFVDDTYHIYAEFDNVGGLKVGSPVKVGGVVIGEVSEIEFNQEAMMPLVTLRIKQKYNNFAENTSISILTSGLLGAQYVGVIPGFLDEETELLKEGDTIYETHSAIVLEDLIGQFLYNRKSD